MTAATARFSRQRTNKFIKESNNYDKNNNEEKKKEKEKWSIKWEMGQKEMVQYLIFSRIKN